MNIFYKTLFSLLFVVAFSLQGNAQGKKYYVTNTDDYVSVAVDNSLRDIIENKAVTGDTIMINVSGTLFLESPIVLDGKNITIIGPSPIHFSIDGSSSSLTGFIIQNGGNVTIEGIKFENFSNRVLAFKGGADAYTGTARIFGCLFQDNTTNSSVVIQGGTEVAFETCSFIGNNSTSSGGAVSVFTPGSTVSKFTNVTFYNNYSSGNGGALSINGDVEILHCTFKDNDASLNGKSLYMGGGNTTVKNTLIQHPTNNSSLVYRGGGTASTLGGVIVMDVNALGVDLVGGTHFDGFGNLYASTSLSAQITDGWGLKYFSYLSGTQPGVDIDQTPLSALIYDQRRVWRVMDSDPFSAGGNYADAGAVEYSPLVVTSEGMSVGSMNDAYFAYTNSNLVGNKAFVFEFTPFPNQTFNCARSSLPYEFNRDNTIINGFSQMGSRIPGPGSQVDSVTSAITPIIFHQYGGVSNGILIDGVNCIVAGVSVQDFTGHSGIVIKKAGTEISGCHIGTDYTGMTNEEVILGLGNPTANDYGIYIEAIGASKIGSGDYCGDLYHSNRNVISNNKKYQIYSVSDGQQLIASNFIGLSANGLDSVSINQPSTLSFPIGIFIGPPSLASPSIIGGSHNVDFNTICHQSIGVKLYSSQNKVFNNRIGSDFTGLNSSNATKDSVGILMISSNSFDNVIGEYILANDPGEEDMGNVIVNCVDGILIKSGAHDNKVYNNNIGVDDSGLQPIGNIIGVHIQGNNTALNNIIGDAYKGNVISGNDLGILLDGSAKSNTIFSNLIGLAADSVTFIGNITNGIEVFGNPTTNNIIGGVGKGNFIVSSSDGIVLTGSSSTTIQGNYIGYQAKDSISAAGFAYNAIIVNKLPPLTYSINNTIGGCNPGEGNYIGNVDRGISLSGSVNANDIIMGNKIGIDQYGNSAPVTTAIHISGGYSGVTIGDVASGCGNEIANNANNGIVTGGGSNSNILVSGNSIHDNGGEPFDLDDDGFNFYGSSNAPNDNSSSPCLQISSAILCGGSGSGVKLTLNSDIAIPFVRIEIFTDTDGADPEIFVEQIDIPSVIVGSQIIDLVTTSLIVGDTIRVSYSYKNGGLNYEQTSEFTDPIAITGPPAALFAGNNTTICEGTTSLTLPDNSQITESGTAVWFLGSISSATRIDTAQPLTVSTSLLPSGSYTYLLVDSIGGCYGASSSVTVNIAPLPIANAGNDTTVCDGGSVTISGALSTGAVSYLWSNGSNTMNNTVSPTSDATYTLTVTDLCGNNSSDDINVTVLFPPILNNISPTVSVCYGDAAFVSFSATPPAESIIWTASGNTLGSGINGTGDLSFTPTNSGTDSYTVTAYIGGCASTSNTFVINANSEIIANPTISSPIICNGNTDGELTATATGGDGIYSYIWYSDATLSTQLYWGQTFSNVSAGTYYVKVTDGQGCFDSAAVTISEPPVLSVSEIHSNISCFGAANGSISASASGGIPGTGGVYQYAWTIAGNPVGTNSANITNLTIGTYDLLITDGLGCLASITNIMVSEPVQVLNSISAASNSICLGDSIQLTSVGSSSAGTMFTHSWSPIGVVSDAMISNPYAMPTATLYVYDTITDANGCKGLDSIQIIVNALPATMVSSTDPTCFGDTDGAIDFTSLMGAPPFQFSVDGGTSWSTSSPVTGLADIGTSYQAVMKDNNGCQTSITPLVVQAPTQVSFNQIIMSSDTCSQGVGEIQIIASGGTPGTTQPYTYSFDNPTVFINLNTISGFSSGTHNLIIKDSSGCLSIDSLVTLDDATGIDIDINSFGHVQCHDSTNGYINVDIVSNPFQGAVSYVWTDINNNTFSTLEDVLGLGTGSYTVIATDIGGCTDTILNTLITKPDSIVFDLQTTTAGCSGNGSIIVSSVVGGSNMGYQYSIDGGGYQTNSIFAPLPASGNTPYQITVSDDQGCTSSDTISVTGVTGQANRPTIHPIIDTLYYCQGDVINDTIHATSPSSNIGTMTWFFDGTTFNSNSDTVIINNGNIESGWLTVSETVGPCISDPDSLYINYIKPDFIAEHSHLMTYCPGISVNLEVSGTNVSWLPNAAISDINSGTTTAFPVGDSSVYFATQTIDGCTFTDSVLVILDSDCENVDNENNAFSPNGDGINEFFVIDLPLMLVNDNKVYIYNRWGDQIKNFLNYNNSDIVWDGKNEQGELVPLGTYFYIVEIPEKQFKKSGWIQIVR